MQPCDISPKEAKNLEKMHEPLVSVIMPAYNAGKYIGPSVRSVLEQTYAHWELWIIDDGSSDNTKEIIEHLAQSDARIHACFMPGNTGTAAARNKGIAESRGKYIAFLDADDLWKNNKLEIQVAFMEEKGCALSYSWYEVMDAEGKPLKRLIKSPGTITYRRLLRSNVIGCLTAMYNAEILGKMYMPDIRKRQDYGLWLDILRKKHTACGMQQSLAWYRDGHSSLSSGNKIALLKYNWILLRKQQKLNVFASAFYFAAFFCNKSLKFARKKLFRQYT